MPVHNFSTPKIVRVDDDFGSGTAGPLVSEKCSYVPWTPKPRHNESLTAPTLQ